MRFVEIPPTREAETFSAAVLRGLSLPQKELPSRFFYDTTGSRLFERITRLPEYYLTRCESEILEKFSREIIESSGYDLQIVEFGSGSGEKTRRLLEAAVERQHELEYVPIDISAEFLRAAAAEIVDDVRGVWGTALAGDYLDALAHLPFHEGPRLFLFLGSTIGNFERAEAIDFLASVCRVMRSDDRLLVGVDLKKPREVIEPAYNDSQGLTEQFNKNLLVRINRELCGHFDLDQFAHSAPWLEEESRIEMRLVSKRDQEVRIEELERTFSFRKGEYIHTENSHKWSADAFRGMATEANLAIDRTWVDSSCRFALNLLRCAG